MKIYAREEKIEGKLSKSIQSTKNIQGWYLTFDGGWSFYQSLKEGGMLQIPRRHLMLYFLSLHTLLFAGVFSLPESFLYFTYAFLLAFCQFHEYIFPQTDRHNLKQIISLSNSNWTNCIFNYEILSTVVKKTITLHFGRPALKSCWLRQPFSNIFRTKR